MRWGEVHESPGVDWRKSPQEVSNMLHLRGGGAHNISLSDWRGDGWARNLGYAQVSSQPSGSDVTH